MLKLKQLSTKFMAKRKVIELDKNLFWDINLKDLDYQANQDFIIGRVLIYGDLADFKQLKSFYSWQVIKSTARHLKYLDDKSLNFWSLVFKIPANKFLCTTK